MPQQPLRVKFIADSGFAEFLKAEAVAHPDDLAVEPERTEKDATKLGFDLATAVSIVAVLKGAIDAATFAGKIYTWWSEKKKKQNSASSIILKTSFGTLELHSNHAITQDDIRKFFEAATIAVK